MSRRLFCLLVCVALSAVSGCCNARYVALDSVSGVVAIPANTNGWPNYNRDKAEELMRQKFPAGYVVDREEEVVIGQIEHTHTDTDRKGDPLLAALYILPVIEHSHQTVSTTDDTEWRIWFRAK